MWIIRLLAVTTISIGLSQSAFGATDATGAEVDGELAARFARLALDCVQREYPNKIGHVLNADQDARTPSSLHPVFYGCFDWHSSVHGHWLLVRLLRTVQPGQLPAGLREQIITALQQNFTVAGVAEEVAYFQAENRKSYERPYGVAWFLQLTAELREWQDPLADEWLEILSPLEAVIVAQLKSWLPNLAYAIRLGTHNQSMFAFTLNEPSGEDFLSPCLMEADLMRRIMPQAQFANWLGEFLPGTPIDGSGDWLATGIVKDPTDGKLVHLDGVNLSRAWNLENIAAALPESDRRRASLLAAAEIHAQTGIANVSAEHYEGSHWLASFATYLVTRRGIL